MEATWIKEEYIRAMVGLHQMGFAHSFEAWRAGSLVGGVFGVQIGWRREPSNLGQPGIGLRGRLAEICTATI